MLLKDNMKVLFQGDSITDCGRTNDIWDKRFFFGEILGNGYPHMVSSYVTEKYPSLNIQYFNRAISGNRSCDLVNRWQEDCLDICPDLMVMMIGINDVWRKFDQNDETETEQYIKNVRYLIESLKEKNPNVKVIIFEPFYYNKDSKETKEFRKELIDKIEALRILVKELGCYYVPLDGIIASKCMNFDFTKYLFDDGVHLTSMGHGVLAKQLIDVLEKY